MKQWQCSVCGYVHKGEEPPDKCPVCGADKSRFVLIADPAAPPSGPTPQIPQRDPEVKGSSSTDSWSKLSHRLTQLHAHPIAVHIPNGVLPITVFFAFLAWLFSSTALATAAKFNMFLVFLCMPWVIFTGLIDWKNRFKARMTPVFRAKMICAGIVTVLSLILSIWWLIKPTSLVDRGFSCSIFLLLHLLDLVAAAIAGWYGGKLVFPKR
jgi:rubredoxin/uncharacterized membrane protein